MKITLCEFLGAEEKFRDTFTLSQSSDVITIGRGSQCTYKIGKGIGDWSKGISLIQCTITVINDVITLTDGSGSKKSANGIWHHYEPIESSIVLVPGMDLTLYKQGRAKVCLSVRDAQHINNENDTYTGEDLMTILQDQIVLLQNQVGILGVQLNKREETDSAQSFAIESLQKRLKKVVTGALVIIGLVVLGTGLIKDFTLEERKEYRTVLIDLAKTVLISGACGGAAISLNKDQKEEKDNEQ